jgi:hypothetical protein
MPDEQANYGLDVVRLNHTGSCSVDFGHGNKFQVLGNHQTWKGGLADRYTFNSSNILRSAVWPLGLLNDDLNKPLDNETYAGVTNPVVALGNVHVQRCSEHPTTFEEGLCITSAEECALSLCRKKFEMSVVNGTTNTRSTDEDFGCLSQVHDEPGGNSSWKFGTGTRCWQAGQSCANLEFVNLTSLEIPEDPYYPGLEFRSGGIVFDPSTVQTMLLARLTGNQSAEWAMGGTRMFIEYEATASSFTMAYITDNGLGPVLTGVAASLTQQALLANTSEISKGTVSTTETYVAVNWPWLIYPAALVLGSIVLLALTALHSHRCGLKIWKSSMLPLLYRTLDPDLLARQPVLHDVSMMTGVAGKAKVTLVETSREDGVVLTQ